MFIFRVVLAPDYVETHPSPFLIFCLFLGDRTGRLRKNGRASMPVPVLSPERGFRDMRSGRWRCVGRADWLSSCCGKRSYAERYAVSLRICALATVMYSVGDLNGRSYAKFHPSLRFSAVYLLLLERLRRPFGPAPDARGRGSFRHGTVGYFPAIVGGRVSRRPLFRGSGPLRSADAQVLQHWG